MTKKTAANRKPTLRDALKAHTRQRLLEAARSVFFREGYYGATIDQIVVEAGAARPTFYLHFRDKEEVLGELMGQYMTRALPYVERLPGPRPTVDELKGWLVELGKFFRQEKALQSVLTEVSGHGQSTRTHYGLASLDWWITALGRHAPAFAAAQSRSSADVNARARAELLMIEIVWAGANVSTNEGTVFTEATLDIVATSFHDFLNDSRFHAGTSAQKQKKAATGRVPARQGRGKR